MNPDEYALAISKLVYHLFKYYTGSNLIETSSDTILLSTGMIETFNIRMNRPISGKNLLISKAKNNTKSTIQ